MKRAGLAVCLLSVSALAQKPYSGLGAESVAKEDIARFAPPPLAPAVSRRIQAMLDVRGAGGGALTAKADRMYFAWSVTGSTQVWRQDGPMKFPIQMTAGDDRTTVAALAPDDSFVVISRDVGGEENPGLYLQKPDGGALQLVQHVPKVQTFLEYVTEDSKAIYFRANDVDPASFAIYRYDVATKQKTRVFDTPGLWSISDHQGDTWLMSKRFGEDAYEVYTYDTKTKQLTPLLGQGESEEYEVAFGPKQILVRTNKLGDYRRVYALDGGKLVPITPEDKHDVDALAIDRKRLRIYYSVNDDGFMRLHVLDAKTLKPLALPALPAADSVRLVGVSNDGRFAQVAVESANQLPQTFVYDWQTRKLVAWRAPMAPEVDPKSFAKATLEFYPARDGTRIPMFVRRPASCTPAPCPVVVSFHGGPEGQATPRFNGTSQLYVDAGFILVEPNVRGSLGYGKAWLHADDAAKRLAVITDIEDCAKYIRATWGAGGKPPKIGVTGGSYGGYATLMAMTYFAGAYDAGVQQVGISNLLSYLLNTSPYRRALRITEYGDPVKDKDALVQLSPITHVAKLKAPLLSIQGLNDPRVPAGEAIQIYREAERRKVPGGLILFADEGHGQSKRSNQVLAIGHTIAFFEKHLLGR